MERDHKTIKYIVSQTAPYNDKRLTDVLVRAFELMCVSGDHNGCLSTSVALHVILRSYGYDPKLCYGLCTAPEGNQIYHAWLELDSKVIDIAIYGNSHFSPLWFDNPLPTVVFEPYNKTALQYGDHIFDNEWDMSMISLIVKMGSISSYIEAAPSVPHPSGNGMWYLIFMLLGEKYTQSRHSELQRYVSTESLQGPE